MVKGENWWAYVYYALPSPILGMTENNVMIEIDDFNDWARGWGKINLFPVTRIKVFYWDRFSSDH